MDKTMTTQRGFTLIETIFVVGLLSGIMMVLTIFLQDYMRREQMRGVAGYIQLVQNAVGETVDTVGEFEALYSLALANGGVAEISILDPANPNRSVGYAPTNGVNLENGGGNLRPNNIVHAGFDPSAVGQHSAFRDTLPIRSSTYAAGVDGPVDNARRDVRLTVIAKIVDDPADTTDERAMEVMVVSVDRLAIRDIQDIAREMKAEGGYITAESSTDQSNCHPTGCHNTARSAYGNWFTHLPDFSGTPWYNSVLTASPATEQEGYIVSYRYLNEAHMAGDYMYRQRIAGNPELNRMYTTLDLGGNNIIGADNVEILPPTSGVGAVLAVGHSLYARGSMFVQDSLQVRGDMIVDGDMSAGILGVDRGYDVTDTRIIPPSHGNIVVEDVFNANQMATSGDLYAQSARFGDLQSAQLSTNVLTVGTTLTVDRPEGLFTGDLDAGSADIRGLARTGQMNTQTLTAGSMGTVEGRMDGGLRVTNDSLAAEKVSTTGGLAIENLVECLAGC